MDETSKAIGTGIGIAAMGVGLGIAFDAVRSFKNQKKTKHKPLDFPTIKPMRFKKRYRW